MTLNGAIALACVISPNSIDLEANDVTVVKDKPIMSAEYPLPLLAKHQKLNHAAVALAWSLCHRIFFSRSKFPFLLLPLHPFPSPTFPYPALPYPLPSLSLPSFLPSIPLEVWPLNPAGSWADRAPAEIEFGAF